MRRGSKRWHRSIRYRKKLVRMIYDWTISQMKKDIEVLEKTIKAAVGIQP